MTRDRDKLSDILGIKEMSLSSSGLSEDQESILVLGNKPKGLENQDVYLRFAYDREDTPEAFFAQMGTFYSGQKLPDSEFSQNGWSYEVIPDPDGNKTTKNYYVHLKNKNTKKEYCGIPVTKNHFNPGADLVHEDLLIVDKRSFDDNPNFTLSLNHKKIKIEAVDGKWAISPKDPLCDRIKLPGNTVEVHNPEQLYLLTEEELSKYNSKGSRKGWSEDKGKAKEGLRSFVKKENKNGNIDIVDRRYVKEIMIPMEVDGEKKPVKHYLLSDEKTLQEIEIMEPISKKDENEPVIHDLADDTEQPNTTAAEEAAMMSESSAHFKGHDTPQKEQVVPEWLEALEKREGEEMINQDETEDVREFIRQGDPEKPAVSEKLSEPAKQNNPAKQKVVLTGLANDIHNIISTQVGKVSPAEKAFLEGFNEIQSDPGKRQKALESIKNSQEHENIFKAFGILNDKGTTTGKGQVGAPDEGNSDSKKRSVSGGEAAFGVAAGAVTGLAQGAIGLMGKGIDAVGTLAGGTFGAVNQIIENHQKRKQYELEHPEIAEKKLAAKKEKLMIARRARAEDSNSILDAKIESVLGSKQYIEQHPGVQQMFNMIEEDPTMKDQLKGWLDSAAADNPVFAEHVRNVEKNAGVVARAMEENLKLNALAGADIGERKAKFEQFNERFTNDDLADVLPDTDVDVPDGEQAPTIKESITKAINNIMKMLKAVMSRLTGRKNQGESAAEVSDQGEAPAMSR